MPRENLWKEAKGQFFHLSLVISVFGCFLKEEMRRRGLGDLKIRSDVTKWEVSRRCKIAE